MFARAAAVFVLAPFIATAIALPGGSPPTCATGPIQCCNSVQSADSSILAGLLAILDISVGSIVGNVGVNCLGILGGNSCAGQAVCCTNNSFNGLVALGCTPVNVNL